MKHYENFAMPIGSVVASFLNWETFKKHVGIPGWSTKSEWAPCDGRAIDTSMYSGLSGIKTAPDMRGLFLRGFNVIDPHENPAVPAAQKNPDEPAIGAAQTDAFAAHKHQSLSGEGFVAGGGNNNYARNDAGWNVRTDTTEAGYGSETRPKNMSVYYYIKIN